jgi:hypothetical protein
MKKLFIISAFAVLTSTQAKAANCNDFIVGISGCFASAATSSGTGRTCDGNMAGCYCSDLDGVLKALGSACSWGWSEVGQTLNGRKCCHNDMLPSEPQMHLQSTAGSDLSEVFMPKTAAYYGYVNSTVRSPTAGRAQSIEARLDICMGSNDTDSAIATMNANTCYNSYCGSSYNEYCQASGTDGGWSGAYAVCHDRCECAINGVGDSSCNQL